LEAEMPLPIQIGGIMLLKRAGKAFALFSLLFAAGCSSTGSISNVFPPAGNNPIKIESEPAGADVYLMGDKVGVTPMQITSKDVFPNIYPPEKVSVYGRVTLKKAGCADFTRTVDGAMSSAGLHAKLDCGDINPASTQTSSTKQSGDVPRSGETAEQRLGKVKDLLNKGLITEEEAKKARERILNEL
jgi:hypothetical protein